MRGIRIGDDDADEQANDEQRQLDAGFRNHLVEGVADENDHIEHQYGAQKPDMADVVNRLFGGVVGQADDRVGRRRSGEMVTSDENAGDWTADEARDDQAERRGCYTDFERIGEPEALGDDRRPGNRCSMPADERC